MFRPGARWCELIGQTDPGDLEMAGASAFGNVVPNGKDAPHSPVSLSYLDLNSPLDLTSVGVAL
jgi:hypothetical protein